MTKLERNDWSESLRGKLELFSAMAGTLYGAATFLIFGSVVSEGPDSWVVHLLLSSIGPLGLSLFVFHNILVRQLALPAAFVGAVYSFSKFHGIERYFSINLCGLAVVTMIVIGLVEARATTGQLSDFWRSFVFHPLDWTTYFHIRTRVE